MKITKEKMTREIRAYLLITFGLLIYTFAVTAFLAPHRMVGGGVTGISTIIYFLSGEVIPIGYSYFVINFLLVAIAIKVLGPRFGFKTVPFFPVSCVVRESVFPWQTGEVLPERISWP